MKSLSSKLNESASFTVENVLHELQKKNIAVYVDNDHRMGRMMEIYPMLKHGTPETSAEKRSSKVDLFIVEMHNKLCFFKAHGKMLGELSDKYDTDTEDTMVSTEVLMLKHPQPIRDMKELEHIIGIIVKGAKQFNIK